MLSCKENSNRVSAAFQAGIRNGHTTTEKLEPYLASLLDFMDFHNIESFSQILAIEKNRLDDMIITYLNDIDARLVCRGCRLVWNETAEMFTSSIIFYKAIEYFCALHHLDKPFWDYIKATTNLEFLWYNSNSGEVLGYDRSRKAPI